MDCVCSVVEERGWDTLKGIHAGAMAGDDTQEKRQRRVAVTLYAQWVNEEKAARMVTVMSSTTREECHVVFVRTPRDAVPVLRSMETPTREDEREQSGVVLLYNRPSKSQMKAVLSLAREKRMHLAAFRDSQLTLPLTKLINEDVSDARGRRVTYWSCISPTRIRNVAGGWSRLSVVAGASGEATTATTFRDVVRVTEEVESACSHRIHRMLEASHIEGRALEVQRMHAAIASSVEARHRQRIALEPIGVESAVPFADEGLHKLPRMSVDDPANLWIGAKEGDVVRFSVDDSLHHATRRVDKYRLVTRAWNDCGTGN